MRDIRLSGVIKESIVDGPGIRYVVFTQGCPHKCEGCHNPSTHDFNAGYIKNTEDIYNDIIKNPMIKGVTMSGGEPFAQPYAVYDLVSKLKDNGYHIMSYSGYTFDEIYEKSMYDDIYLKLLEKIDVLVDGRFELQKKDLTLKFRGSSNQRIIDVPKTLKTGEVVIHEMCKVEEKNLCVV